MHRSGLVVLSCLFGLGLISGCRENSTFREAFDAGLQCTEKQRFIEGACQSICERDADCPAEQRCNLLMGTCEPRPAAVTPSSTVPCTTGAERCSASSQAVERCNAAGTWETKAQCPGTGYCLNGECKICQPGVATCSPANNKTVTVCTADGSGTRTFQCEGATICSQGECRECAPNTTRCNATSTTVQICQRSGDEKAQWKWTNHGDGFDGSCITQVCETVGANQARCKAASCFPRTAQCSGPKTQQVCSDRGEWQSFQCSAQPGMSDLAECLSGICIDECADAVKARSYFGCDYWTAISDNSVTAMVKANTLSGQGTVDSEFAFVASNRSELPTTVEVWRHFTGTPRLVKTVTLEGRSGPTRGLAVIKVPWQSIGAASQPTGISATGLAKYAYRVKATRPITLYQFNPLDAAKVGKACSGSGPDLSCSESPEYSFFVPETWGSCETVGTTAQKSCHYFTYSNDASLILPAHILSTSYVVMAPEHVAFPPSQTQPATRGMGAHLVIVAPQDGTTVTLRSSAVTRAGGTVPALAKGQTATLTLNSYDVLQIATTDLGANYLQCGTDSWDPTGRSCRVDNDLTGTIITTDKPVAVFGGSACTVRPFDKPACDHVEEQMFPFETWGKHFVAQFSHPLRLASGGFATAAQSGGDYWKIVAGCPQSQCPAGTLLTLSTPPPAADVLQPNRCVTGSIATNDCRLLGGQYMEFRSKQSFTITADQPIMVGQFFSGQGASTGTPLEGDPSFILLPPVEQWRASYTVLAAPNIRSNYLGLVYDDTKVSGVIVDGVSVAGATLLPGTTYRVKNHPVASGTHNIQVIPRPGQTTFPGVGVTSYGYDSYVSYGYTGGLDLTTIVTGINPGG